MTRDQIADDELSHIRARILSEDVPTRRALVRTLDQLATAKHTRFLHLCYQLMDDSEPRVRSHILWHLMRAGDRDDAIAESKALAVLNDRTLNVGTLRSRAILALGTVGTVSVVPVLYEYCLAGEMFALLSFARQVRCEPQRQEALHLSREWLMSETYQRRDEALRALRSLSSAAAEERLLLQAYRRYGDELVVWALGAASAQMLPVLTRLLTRWPEDSAQRHDVLRALNRLKRRLTNEAATLRDSVNRPLREYL